MQFNIAYLLYSFAVSFCHFSYDLVAKSEGCLLEEGHLLENIQYGILQV